MGYTNAGKSTLFNALANAGVVVRDKLFSTLDPVTRRVWLPGGGETLFTDTVGFIQKLPPTVVAAFRATLQELQEADLLLHVVDISHPKAPEQAEAVDETLKELGLGDKPRLLVLNKMDSLVPAENWNELDNIPGVGKYSGEYSSVVVSAALGWNLTTVLEKIEDNLKTPEPLKPTVSMASDLAE